MRRMLFFAFWLLFSALAVGQDLNVAGNKYAWLQEPPDGSAPPPLNIVLDCSRERINVAREWAEENLFSTNVIARMQFRVCPLELSVAAIDNANVLVVPSCSGNAFPEYDKSEIRIMSGFVERGGLLVVPVGAGSFANEKFLGDYGAKFKEVYRDKIGVAKCTPMALRGSDIETSEEWDKRDFLWLANSFGWVPILTASNEDGEACALMAVKKVGKGYILYCHHVAVREWMNNKMYAKIVDALARQIRRIDPNMPFENIPITSGVCRRVRGIPIYSSEKFAMGAMLLQDELNRFIPELKKEWGDLFYVPTNLAYRAIGAKGLHGCSWGGVKCDNECGLSIFPAGVCCDSPLEGMVDYCGNHWGFHFLKYTKSYINPRYKRFTWAGTLGLSLRAALVIRAMARSGHGKFADKMDKRFRTLQNETGDIYRAITTLINEEPDVMTEVFKAYIRREDSNDFATSVGRCFNYSRHHGYRQHRSSHSFRQG